MKRAIALLVVWSLPGVAAAQLVPGQHHFMAHAGPLFPTGRLLKATAQYPVPRPGNKLLLRDVMTDMTLDPGLFTGGRYAYDLTRRLQIEAEVDWGLAVFVTRQLELKPDEEEGLPQYETTTTDARILQMFVNMTYYLGSWSTATPYLTVGIGDHNLDLRQKGEVDPDPIHDRAVMAGLGVDFHASDRLGIRVEVRNYMYNFSFDNQYVDPVRSQDILYRRPELINTTSVAGPRFQNDLTLSIGFMVRSF